jgi:ABC-2 type transport system ATP-binding protein
MEQVEQLCQTICLINQGKVVLEGSLTDVKSSYREKRVEVAFDGPVPQGIEQWLSVLEAEERYVVGSLQHGLASTLQGLMDLGQVLEFSVREPTLEEIFISSVKGPEL